VKHFNLNVDAKRTIVMLNAFIKTYGNW